jgi:hypothetical protein
MDVTANTQAIRARREDLDGGDDFEAIAGAPDDANMAARAERVAANQRYDELVSAGNRPDPCLDFTGPDHDYDRCVKDPVADPVLFQQQDADASAVDPKDVLQGRMGDCYLLAPLAALASSPQGRALIRGAIVENKNGAGEVVGWTVTLHRPETHLFGRTTYCEVRISVSNSFVIGCAQIRSGNGANEVWPLVLEKACAQCAGGYNAIARGGTSGQILALLTGREPACVSLDRPNRWFHAYGVEQLQADLASGKPVVFDSRSDIVDPPAQNLAPAQLQANLDAHRLIAAHAYFAMGVEQHDGRAFLRLGNPWGRSPPDLIPCDELARWFRRVTIGSVP